MLLFTSISVNSNFFDKNLLYKSVVIKYNKSRCRISGYEKCEGCSQKTKNLSCLEVYKVVVLKIVLTVLYVIVCLALIVVVLGQESKSEGLSGSISGMAETYWGKNKGRSLEGTLEVITKILAVAFIVLSIVLNIL